MKALIFILLVILTAGCVEEDLDDTFNKTHIKPEYSIPLGATTYRIKEEFNSFGSSSVPGIYGLIYYNDDPYTLDHLYLTHTDTEDFSFNLSSKWIDNAERISFHLHTESSLPTQVITQVYFLNRRRNIVDSLSTTGPIQINAGSMGIDGKVNAPGISSYDFPLTHEQISRFSDIKYYYISSHIQAYKPGQPPVRFYESNQIVFNVGVRIKLNLGLDQL